jgi:CBS domain-containing membrane protein
MAAPRTAPRPDPPAPPPRRAAASRLPHALAGLRPAMARPAPREILRAAIGVTLALLAAAGVIALGQGAGAARLYLIAPLGASALLMVAVPNSPLAQPWPVLVGNTGGAVIGIACALALPWPPVAAAAAVGGATLFMQAARALHPPAGGVALAVVLAAEGTQDAGFLFALSPVAAVSALLVLLAMLWNRATGRVYPFRQPEAPGTADAARDAGLTEADLGAILQRLRLSSIIGVADFARLLGAVGEIAAADRSVAGLTCASVMTRDPVTIAPDATLEAATRLMLARGLYSLPVAWPDGRLAGILSQSTLLRLTQGTGTEAPDPARPVAEVMTPQVVSVRTDSPLSDALSALAAGGYRTVPVLDADGRLAGVLSRSDLVAVLARRPGPAGPAASPSPAARR